jgi:rhodanese-related sulfurtransferase
MRRIEMPTSAMQRVAEAKQRVENLTVEQTAAEIARGALVVDLRESEERQATGVIPGAVHVPRGVLEFQADPALPTHHPALQPDRRIILHCAAGGRSALGADVLREMGYTNVAHLDGGFTAWQAAGQAVEPST